MPIDPDTFRSVLGRFASGVTVVTTRDASGRDHGLTVSAFASLSLAPPLILVCIDHTSSVYPVLREAPYFVVNLLSASQEAMSRRFAGPSVDRFDGLGYSRAQNGIAVLDDVLAHIECRNARQHAEGDHTIFVGEVEGADVNDARPLLYYRGGYAALER